MGRLRAVLVAASCALLAGCGESPAALPLSDNATAPSAAHGRTLPAAILVADSRGNAILGFPLDASGNEEPSTVISGKNTRLGHADGLGLDRSDRIFVNVDDKRIAVFAATATGNVRPVSQIRGAKTELSQAIGIAVDSVGYLYVADCGSDDVKVFAPGAQGDVSPVRIISLTTGCPMEETIDRSDDLYVTSGDNIISEFGSYQRGNTPIKEIQEHEVSGGDGIRSIALDSQSNLYVGNLLAKDIRVFAPTASGFAKPIRGIHGSQTHLGAPTGLSLDSADRLYVTICRHCHYGSGTDSVLVYPPGAKGNAGPAAVITGKNTLLDAPTDLVIRD